MTTDRQYLIKMISMAKSDLQIDDEIWRGAVLTRYGATEKGGKLSLTTLSDTALERLYKELKAKGFKVKRKSNSSMAGWREPRIRLIQSLWAELVKLGALQDAGDRAMEAFCKKYHGKDRLQFAESGGLNKCIEILKGMKSQRHGR
jgi:phage gp16-like protein